MDGEIEDSDGWVGSGLGMILWERKRERVVVDVKTCKKIQEV